MESVDVNGKNTCTRRVRITRQLWIIEAGHGERSEGPQLLQLLIGRTRSGGGTGTSHYHGRITLTPF